MKKLNFLSNRFGIFKGYKKEEKNEKKSIFPPSSNQLISFSQYICLFSFFLFQKDDCYPEYQLDLLVKCFMVVIFTKRPCSLGFLSCFVVFALISFSFHNNVKQFAVLVLTGKIAELSELVSCRHMHMTSQSHFSNKNTCWDRF